MDIDCEQLAASGRTLAEHREIVHALAVDPRGAESVQLDFESGGFEGWSVRRLAQPHSAVIQGDVVRSGTRACRFEIRPGDEMIAGGLRAELRDWYNAPLEQTTCYGFSTLLPESFDPPPGVSVVLAQWHDQAEIGDPAGKPPLALRYADGVLRFTGAFAEVASHEPGTRYVFGELAPVPRGRWLDFAFEVFWSRFGRSGIRAFLDGQPLFTFEGPLGYRNEAKGPYFKLGVYTSGPIAAPLAVYHDAYARAPQLDRVDPARLPSP